MCHTDSQQLWTWCLVCGLRKCQIGGCGRQWYDSTHRRSLTFKFDLLEKQTLMAEAGAVTVLKSPHSQLS